MFVKFVRVFIITLSVLPAIVFAVPFVRSDVFPERKYFCDAISNGKQLTQCLIVATASIVGRDNEVARALMGEHNPWNPRCRVGIIIWCLVMLQRDPTADLVWGRVPLKMVQKNATEYTPDPLSETPEMSVVHISSASFTRWISLSSQYCRIYRMTRCFAWWCGCPYDKRITMKHELRSHDLISVRGYA